MGKLWWSMVGVLVLCTIIVVLLFIINPYGPGGLIAPILLGAVVLWFWYIAAQDVARYKREKNATSITLQSKGQDSDSGETCHS